MTPDPIPGQPGDICWRPEYVAQMLSPVSLVGSDATSWFLSTHSPVTCHDAIGPVSQADIFKDLFGASKPETLCFVKGDTGAGKSQLINWLKLRFDDALQHGEPAGVGQRKLRSVLIRRRSGSLKDALEQLVEQLPEYERYLAKIRAAIEDISGDTAKRRLYSEMHHSLRAHAVDAPRMLRPLDEVFLTNSTVKHLCRDGGAIDRNIERLTKHSDTNAREALPPFTAQDFIFPPNARIGYDEDLALRLEDDESLREQAALWATAHLREAIAGLTGLRGHTLNEIFRQIREQMQRQGEALALFVEDVSTLSVLDEELVNALQPLNDSSLCPLISVLGMTKPAFDRLPDNLRQRADRVLELRQNGSLDSGESNSADGGATDRFVARYLNALRLGASHLQALADDVRQHDEQKHSACESCKLRKSCFEAFGSVQLGEAEIGLYPLAPGASKRLLGGLIDAKLQTPRTLLQQIVLPLLTNMGKFRRGTVGLSVQPRSPQDFAAQHERMLSGWSAEQRDRTSYLVYYWSGSDSLVQGQQTLAPMLPWFGHPDFSAAASASKKIVNGLSGGGAVRTPSPPQPEAIEKRRYDEAIERLGAWYLHGGPLTRDSEFRNLLVQVIRNSLPLDDVRDPSDRIRTQLMPIGSANVTIEGMVTRAAVRTRVLFQFDRSQEVYELLQDLCGFEHLGQRTWHFDGGDVARRRYGAWLANNTDRLINTFNVVKCDRGAVLRTGVRFLHLAYRFSNRKALPSDTAAAVEAIVSFQVGGIQTLTPAVQALADGLAMRVQDVRTVILEEQVVRQGTGKINYIDPRVLIENLGGATDDLSIGSFDGDDVVSEYPAFHRLVSSDWSRLDGVLGAEHEALRALVHALESGFRFWGIPTDPLSLALKEFLESARAVLKAYEDAGHALGDASLQRQINGLKPSVVSRHVSILQEAVDTVESGPLAVLSLDMAAIKSTVELCSKVDGAMRRLEKALGDQLSNVVTADEVEADRQNALATVSELANMGAQAPAEQGVES